MTISHLPKIQNYLSNITQGSRIQEQNSVGKIYCTSFQASPRAPKLGKVRVPKLPPPTVKN